MQCSGCRGKTLFLTSSFLLDKIGQICSKITLKASTFTSTNKKHHFITSIIRSNMNERYSQRIYNIKQGRNVSSGMSVAQSRSTTEIASEKLLAQFDYLRSKTTTPSRRFYKNRWFHSHKLQQGILIKSKTPPLLFIGDSIAYGFKRYPHIWEKYGNLAVNCGIAGDKVENTLWRVENLALPCGIEYAVIICGTNNIGYNKTSGIVNGLLCVALKLVSKSVQQVIASFHSTVLISPFYPETLLTPSEETKSRK